MRLLQLSSGVGPVLFMSRVTKIFFWSYMVEMSMKWCREAISKTAPSVDVSDNPYSNSTRIEKIIWWLANHWRMVEPLYSYSFEDGNNVTLSRVEPLRHKPSSNPALEGTVSSMSRRSDDDPSSSALEGTISSMSTSSVNDLSSSIAEGRISSTCSSSYECWSLPQLYRRKNN